MQVDNQRSNGQSDVVAFRSVQRIEPVGREHGGAGRLALSRSDWPRVGSGLSQSGRGSALHLEQRPGRGVQHRRLLLEQPHDGE